MRPGLQLFGWEHQDLDDFTHGSQPYDPSCSNNRIIIPHFPKDFFHGPMMDQWIGFLGKLFTGLSPKYKIHGKKSMLSGVDVPQQNQPNEWKITT